MVTTSPSPQALFLTIASEKGGQAKTTTSANLLTMLRIMGYRVLGLDCDPQGGLTFSFGINRDRLKKSLYEVLLSEARGNRDFSMRDVILQTYYNPQTNGFIDPTERVDPLDAGSPTKVEALQAQGVPLVKGPLLAPISRNSIRADTELLGSNPLTWVFSLRDALQPILPFFDYVVADTNPSAGCLTGLCLCTSPFFLVPLTPEQLSVQGMINLLKTVRDAKRITNPALQLAGMVFTKVSRYQGYKELKERLREELAENLGDQYADLEFRFYETEIQQCKDGVDAATDRSVAVLHRPNSQHASSYWFFLSELLKVIGGPAAKKIPDVLNKIQAEEERRLELARQKRQFQPPPTIG